MNLDYVKKLHEQRAKRLSEYNLQHNFGNHYQWDDNKYNDVYARLMRERIKLI